MKAGSGATSVRIALTTASNQEEANRIAHALVEGRFAACVNIVDGIHSVYRWREKVEEADEVMLIIKTTEDKLDALERTIKALHSYELPEFVVLSLAGCSRPYLQWILASVR